MVLPLLWCYHCCGVTIALMYHCCNITVAVKLPLLRCYHCCDVTIAVMLPLLYYHCCNITIALTLPFLQYYHCCDATIAVVLPLLWCSHCCGVTIAVMLPLLWCYHCCGVTITVVLPLLFSAVRAVADLPSPPTRAATRHPTAVCTWRVLATGSLTSSRTRTRTGLRAATTIPAPTAVSWVTRPVLEVIRHAYRRQLPRLSLR